MRPIALLSIELTAEPDVVLARQRARLLAELLDFDLQDQTRIATAVSEIARNAFQYAGGGRVSFSVEREDHADAFVVRVADRGPGIGNVDEIFEGRYRSRTGMGVGLAGARKLMDELRIDTGPERGTVIGLVKRRPRTLPPLASNFAVGVGDRLAARAVESPFEEVRQQNQELMHALAVLREREEELLRVNRELAETNTGIRALYAELEDKAEALRAATETKARFHSQMSHEVRTPINAILGLSEVLLDGSVVAPLSAQEKPLGFIRKAAQDLSVLVDDLLDLAKLEAGKMKVRRAPFAVGDLFAALRGMLRPLHRSEAVRLVFDDVSALPALDSDEGKVAQILRNFVVNALKFTAVGEVRVSARWDAERVTFDVRDTGCGIAAADLPHLFEDFSQVGDARAKGTGLGLVVCRNLATLLGGDVDVESTAGEGSVFRLRVPHRAEATLASMGPEDRSVLIIDDDPAARCVLRAVVGDRPVVEATSGEAGLDAARTRRPSIVLLDLGLPGLDGFGVLEGLAADPATARIPVIVHSSRRLDVRERALLDARTVAIVDKADPQAAARVRTAIAAAEERRS